MKTIHITHKGREMDLHCKTPYVITRANLEDAVTAVYADYQFIDELDIRSLFYPEGYMNDCYVRFVFRDGDCPNFDVLDTDDYKNMDDCMLKELTLRRLVVEFLDNYIEEDYPYEYILLDVSW